MEAQKSGPFRAIQSEPARLVHWFCAYCGVWFFSPADEDPDRCPTKGCARPFGFGMKGHVRRDDLQ
jgi:hypothetical protein